MANFISGDGINYALKTGESFEPGDAVFVDPATNEAQIFATGFVFAGMARLRAGAGESEVIVSPSGYVNAYVADFVGGTDVIGDSVSVDASNDYCISGGVAVVGKIAKVVDATGKVVTIRYAVA